MPLSPDDARSPYLQIADELRSAIRRGEFAPGAQLPSTNELVEQYGVARNTVRSALRVLSDEGLLVARQGSGVFVRSALPPIESDDSSGALLEQVLQQVGELASQVRQLGDRVTELEGQVRRGGRRSS